MVNDKFRTNNKYLFQGRPSSVDSLMVSKIVNFVRENKDNNSTTDIIKVINDCFPDYKISKDQIRRILSDQGFSYKKRS
jgi:transposase